MEDQAELIRQQMQETRADLSEKLQELAGKLPSTETVAETVESVSGTVSETAENVQDTLHSFQEAFDLPKQVQEHPWLALGGAVLVGYLAHDILAARQGSGESILAEPMRELEKVAMGAALGLVGQTVQSAIQGQGLGAYGPILEKILGQLTSGQAEKSRDSSPNGRGATHGPTPSGAPAKQPSGAAY